MSPDIKESDNSSTTASSRRLQKILYAEELGHYLSSFIDHQTPSAPQNLDDVIDRITALWQTQGFLQTHDLTSEMLDLCLPDCQPKIREIVREMLSCHSSPDTLTGFARKEATPLLTGLAHLYGVQTGKPIVMIEGDFGNMGGTNEHFRKLLAAERNVPVEQVDIEESFPYTDKAARIIGRLAAKAFTDYIEKNDIKDGHFAAVRSGGDEIRFIVAGIDEKTAEKILEETVNKAVEDFTARAGLHDHPHTKDRSNKFRNGFGAAFTAVQLDDRLDPAVAIKNADVHINANKMRLGYLRHGEVFAPQSQRLQLLNIYQANPDLVPEGLSPATAVEKDMEALALQASERGQYFATVKQASGTTYENASKISLDRAPELSPYAMTQARAKSILQGINAVIDEEYKEYSAATTDDDRLVLSFDDGTQKGRLFQSPETRREQKLLHTLKNANMTITTGERHFLRMALEGLSPKDPPTGANMPKEMPEIASIFAHDTQKLATLMAQRIQDGDKNVTQAFQDAGVLPDDLRAHTLCVSFHNLAGINERYGHHLADIVLHHMANEIIAEALAENGIDQDSYVLSHEGGARFMAVIKPMTYNTDLAETDPNSKIENIKIISEATISAIEKSIADRTNDFNKTEINKFFAQKLGQDNASASMKEPEGELQTFADIPDPKRKYSTGLDVTTAARQLATTSDNGNKLSGGHNLYLVRKDAENKVEQVRNQKKHFYEQNQQTSRGVSHKWAKNATI